jgi:DNA-damage-inducible protein J
MTLYVRICTVIVVIYIEDVAIMSTVSYSFRIEEETKREMDEICHELGMSTSTAFSIFAKRVVAERGLPFKPTVITPPKKRPITKTLREAQLMTKGNTISEEDVLEAVTEGRHT